MKIIEKMTLILYSNLILILSVLLCVIIFRWVDVDIVGDIVGGILFGETSSKIVLGVCAVFILLSIRCIFFDKTSKEQIKERQGVLLQNENGKLMISKDTIENLVKGVVSGFPSVNTTNCKVRLDKQVNNVTIDLNLVVSSETIIKDLSLNLQNRIKEVIKTTTDIEVKEINIKIKNIETPKEPKVKEE